jgi:hypothetical protein
MGKSDRIENILKAKGYRSRLLNPIVFNDEVIGGHHGK